MTVAAEDPPTTAALPAWRSARRTALIQAREALPADALLAARRAIDSHLERCFTDLVRGPMAFCWPYRQEYDARHLLARLRRQGAVTLLPVVVGKAQPMIFRAWKPGDAMTRGPLGIPYPASGAECTPDTVLLPVVGFDDEGYRLGYGGGFFDRTLQALQARGARPRVIGVGHELARLPTIHPQAHDRPLDFMVTERGVYARDAGRFGFCC